MWYCPNKFHVIAAKNKIVIGDKAKLWQSCIPLWGYNDTNYIINGPSTDVILCMCTILLE